MFIENAILVHLTAKWSLCCQGYVILESALPRDIWSWHQIFDCVFWRELTLVMMGRGLMCPPKVFLFFY